MTHDVIDLCQVRRCTPEGEIQNLDEGFSVSELFDADAEAFTVFFGVFWIFAKMTLMTESSAR